MLDAFEGLFGYAWEQISAIANSILGLCGCTSDNGGPGIDAVSFVETPDFKITQLYIQVYKPTVDAVSGGGGLVDAVIDVLDPILRPIADVVVPIWNKASNKVKEQISKAVGVIGAAFDVLPDDIKDAAVNISGFLFNNIKKVSSFIVSESNLIQDFIGGSINSIISGLFGTGKLEVRDISHGLTTIISLINDLVSSVKTVINQTILPGLSSALDWIVEKGGLLYQKIKKVSLGAFTFLEENYNQIKDLLVSYWGKIKTWYDVNLKAFVDKVFSIANKVGATYATIQAGIAIKQAIQEKDMGKIINAVLVFTTTALSDLADAFDLKVLRQLKLLSFNVNHRITTIIEPINNFLLQVEIDMGKLAKFIPPLLVEKFKTFSGYVTFLTTPITMQLTNMLQLTTTRWGYFASYSEHQDFNFLSKITRSTEEWEQYKHHYQWFMARTLMGI